MAQRQNVNSSTGAGAWSRPEELMEHASERTGAVRTGEFSWRPPSPPHMHVPQMADDSPLILPQFKGVGCEPGEYTQALTLITQAPEARTLVREWKYEWRRKAQSILAFLHLGPSSAARDVEYLKQEGITMLLVIRNRMTAAANLLSADKVANQLGIQYAAVDVDGNFELIAAFPRAVKIINDHLFSNYQQAQATRSSVRPDPVKSAGKVLVYCETGNERSAAVVVAYMLNTYGMDLISTIQYVQSQRFCISFDDALKNLLYSYMEILVAQRTVRAVPKASNQGDALLGGTKRDRWDVEDEDMEIDEEGADDDERFQSREDFVPFR